jgi:hypothetical protein
MVKFWERMTIRQRVSLAMLIVTMLGTIGSFIWGYITWPTSVLLIVSLLIPGVRRNPAARNAHPQENDPNRR